MPPRARLQRGSRRPCLVPCLIRTSVGAETGRSAAQGRGQAGNREDTPELARPSLALQDSSSLGLPSGTRKLQERVAPAPGIRPSPDSAQPCRGRGSVSGGNSGRQIHARVPSVPEHGFPPDCCVPARAGSQTTRTAQAGLMTVGPAAGSGAAPRWCGEREH